MSPRRVFVTGVGLVSPHGEDSDDVFEQIFEGRSAVRRVENANGRRGAVGMLAPVTLDPEAVPKVHGRVMARASKMAFVAAGQALSRADLSSDDPARIAAGIYMGCALGGSETLEHHYGRFHADPPKRPRVATTPMIMASGPASHVSMRVRSGLRAARGPVEARPGVRAFELVRVRRHQRRAGAREGMKRLR